MTVHADQSTPQKGQPLYLSLQFSRAGVFEGMSRFSSVDAVLADVDALESFKEWIRLDPHRSDEALNLYFAIKGFKEIVSRGEAIAANVACQVHRRFISLRTGVCSFVSTEVRRQMSERIHSLCPATVPATLFHPVETCLSAILNTWHSSFICSEPFHRLVNEEISPSSDNIYTELEPAQLFSARRAPLCDASTSQHGRIDVFHNTDPPLLVKSCDGAVRHDRAEARLAFASLVSEKLQRIVDELAKRNDVEYARDLPRMLPKDNPRILGGFTRKGEATSDEEVDEYVERIDDIALDGISLSDAYGDDGFAPPPIPYDFNNVDIPKKSSTTRRNRSSRFTDSSGFCSSESAYFSDRSYGTRRNVFNGPISQPSFGATSQSHTLQRRSHLPHPNTNIFATLPRSPIDVPRIKCTLKRDGEQAPYVAMVPGKKITLAEFRNTFGISRRENMRLLFKSACEEDESAPFQWCLISDDHTTIPIFEGKITAQARTYVDSD